MNFFGRKWLLVVMAAWLILAACGQAALSPDPTSPQPQPTAEASETPMTETEPTPTAEEQTTDTDLDLRFANVTQVEFEQLADEEYRFDVTLYHDDEGEAPNYADAWQVLDLEGNLLGERELLHSHGTQPFTRSETITIPTGVDSVIVRGHDMTHGYGGQGMRVDLDSGETTPIQINRES